METSPNPNRVRTKTQIGFHDFLFFAFMVLLPFSTGTDVAVVTYAAPVMLLLGLYYVVRLASIPKVPIGATGIILFLGLLQICWMILLSVPGDRNYPRIARVLPHMFGWLVLFYMTSEVITRGKVVVINRAKQWSNFFVLSAGVLALYYIINIAITTAKFGLSAVLQERYVSGLSALPWGASNTVASTLLFGYVVCVASYLQSTLEPKSGQSRFLGIPHREYLTFILIVISAGIVSTLSRNGIATWALASLPLVTRKWIRPALAFALLGTGIYWFFRANQEIAYTILSQRTTGDEFSSYNNRIEFWEVFASYWYANPFSPIGFYNSLYVFGFSAHNILLTTLVEQSLVAVATMVLTWIVLLRSTLHLYKTQNASVRKTGVAYLIGAAAIVINSNFEDAQFTQQYVVYLWMWMTCLLVQIELNGVGRKHLEFMPWRRSRGRVVKHLAQRKNY